MADYDIGQAFKEIEEELIASMIRNLERHKAWEEDEGFQWDQWQVLQLQSLERYRRLNRKKFKGQFEKISQAVDDAIRAAREDGRSTAEAEILQKIKDGFADYHKASSSMSRDFFRLNERKLNALISATQKDFTKAEHAILRMVNDQYRKVIYSAQVYANSGAGTYEKAIDMATRDFLRAGLNCVEYKNGARHTLHDYADMAIRTATTRAYLAGEGEMRNEWGIHTVIVNKRTAACSKCMPFAGKIMIDDVYANGSRKDGPYTLVSTAIEKGFLHPRCKDTYSTYFPGLDDDKAGEPSKADKKKAAEKEEAEAKQDHARLQVEKYDRMAEYSLDPENQRKYEAKAEEWKNELFKRLPDNEMGIRTEDYREEPGKKYDIIKPRNIIKNIRKTDIGKQALELIGNNGIDVVVEYGTNAIDEQGNILYGSYNPGTNTITIHGDVTKTIEQTAATLIHEAYHSHDKGYPLTRKAELFCRVMEVRHLKGGLALTKEELSDIIKIINQLYAELPWG